MMNRKSLIFLLLGASYLLTACGSTDGAVGEVLGLNRRPPDEFLVLARPPLTLPPNFTLSPTAEDNAVEEDAGGVREVIFGDEQAATAAEAARLKNQTTSAELYLLQETDAVASSDDIRSLVDLETAQLVEEDESFIRGLIGTQPEFGTALEAEEEAERLQELEQ